MIYTIISLLAITYTILFTYQIHCQNWVNSKEDIIRKNLKSVGLGFHIQDNLFFDDYIISEYGDSYLYARYRYYPFTSFFMKHIITKMEKGEITPYYFKVLYEMNKKPITSK